MTHEVKKTIYITTLNRNTTTALTTTTLSSTIKTTKRKQQTMGLYWKMKTKIIQQTITKVASGVCVKVVIVNVGLLIKV